MADLFRLDYFEDVKVNPLAGTADDRMILDIEVVEKPTGTFTFGGGYSAVDKLYVMASVSERNFLGRGRFWSWRCRPAALPGSTPGFTFNPAV
ncbi:MAG: hypothetical protein R2860_09905 [Desulfobacterales bacterium]